ncbi:MAG: hypothetical protein E5V37_03325 [Mesorhizobium sp.]|uniref:hypothetical protein n=2 Tax=Mesorhizobium TaxID=68287 RepID=UPI000FCAEA50|nr:MULTISPECIES: hypothetical protein [unclassified Mesorhizobium]RVC68091.1 hypothetical protein EN759_13085 [Mesorhizobium sp. M00.F.Ca.ET.038.03.1.1]RVC76079.1 hypothetical protein EN766_14615 [Mesorhizobium sp. M2A.F.Ca.ET.046.02.1.1]RUW42990.1 hypothetical protein EOA37_02220 [Mesorhizobium sp. M2A.F.Ca.ET.015.02.1.1]RVD02558.1 hypothetical protein EN753_22650 [Mesorhizobium sp. M2A.F.Ca.ET.029.05.1.1]RWB47578.1 MAG: hypothetical protein EOQ46_05970 [Mesorhizobium sp.]
MTVPAHWPEHWRRAAAGDHSGLASFDDNVRFFMEANNRSPNWRHFSEAERDRLVDLSCDVTHLTEAFHEAMDIVVYGRAVATSRPVSTSHPAFSDFRMHEKAKAPPAQKPAQRLSWDKAIAKTNSGFSGMARQIYAGRRGA